MINTTRLRADAYLCVAITLSVCGCAQNGIFELEFDFSAVSDLQTQGSYEIDSGAEFNGVRVAVLAADGVLDSLSEGAGAPGVLDFNAGSDVFRFNSGAEGNVLRLSVVSESEPTELAVVLRYCSKSDTDCMGRVEGVSADESRREYWFVFERPLYRGRVTGFSFDMLVPGLPDPVCGGENGEAGCTAFAGGTTFPQFSESSNVCAETPETPETPRTYCRIPQCRIACGGADQEGLTHCRGSEDGLSPPHECDD